MGNGTTTTTVPPKKKPGTLMGDIFAGIAGIGKKRKQYKEAEEISADSGRKGGNPCHYQTHVNDGKKNRQGARRRGKSCHHGR